MTTDCKEHLHTSKLDSEDRASGMGLSSEDVGAIPDGNTTNAAIEDPLDNTVRKQVYVSQINPSTIKDTLREDTNSQSVMAQSAVCTRSDGGKRSKQKESTLYGRGKKTDEPRAIPDQKDIFVIVLDGGDHGRQHTETLKSGNHVSCDDIEKGDPQNSESLAEQMLKSRERVLKLGRES